jgi:hypothetical protein
MSAQHNTTPYKPKRGRPRSPDSVLNYPDPKVRDLPPEEQAQRREYFRQQRAKHQAAWRARHPERAKEAQRRYMERRLLMQRGHYLRDAICPLCSTPHQTTHAARLYCSVECRSMMHAAAALCRGMHTQHPDDTAHSPNFRPALAAVQSLTWAQPAQQ